jgi:RNA methyltransferase, TrmH family
MLSRREERLLRSLGERRARDAERLFVAEGVRTVEDLVASPLAIRFAVVASSAGDSPRAAGVVAALVARGVAVHEVGERVFADLVDTATPQGVLAVAAMPDTPLPTVATGPEPAVLLVLDAVQDPGNLGTLVRTAEALGAIGVALLAGTVDPWNPKAVRAAMGSTFRLPVVQATWAELDPWLHAGGFEVLAAVVGAAPVDAAAGRRSALVLGNEGSGVSAASLARADRRVGIPLRGRAESLNVAAAGAILLHDLLR